jgi:elongation factor Ts
MNVTTDMVKTLRERTSAGVMDCKEALTKAEGDMEKAISYLREKGKVKAAQKAGRETRDGIVGAYIHPGSRLGVLVEINCETDFVAKTGEFKSLVKELAMQIAASNPLVIRREDLPQGTVEKEKEIYRNQALNEGKKEEIIERVVKGRMEKFYREVCLLEQPYIKDEERRVQDLLDESIAKLGENITISRFTRFKLGE